MKLPTIADYAMKTARTKYVVTDDTRDAELARLTAENARFRDVVGEAIQQIEYLHGKFQKTGSGENVLARLNAALEATYDPV